ncbi:MAG: MaoC/PaaZ C-terminal domain-containing protein [Candidatus Binatia bacterium]|nr:MaoC/PaaZ C-terminal domain-containing protein [Candidatus Binatia bacterium]
MTLRAADLEVGTVFERVVVDDLKRTQLVMYSGASGDFHPFHSDEIFAKAAGSPRGVFGHGMFTMAVTGRLLTDTVGDGRLTSYTARFIGQIWPGDTLTTRATVVGLDDDSGSPRVELEIETRTQDDVVVLSGRATARAD